MSLGRLAMATNWSGNLDYMRPDNSLLVDFELVPLKPGDYPHHEGQEWAEADIDHAKHLLLSCIDSPPKYRDVVSRGNRAITQLASNRSIGLRILERQRVISEQMSVAKEKAELSA